MCKEVTVFLIFLCFFMIAVCFYVCDRVCVSAGCQTDVTGHESKGKFTPPPGGSTAQHRLTSPSPPHTPRCCSRLPSLNGDHSETKESATMFSSISKCTAEGEKRENETGKCNQQVFHKTPARKRHDRFSQVCPKKYLHTYI